MTNKTLNKKLVGSSVENIALQKGEKRNYPNITPDILAYWGDSNGIFNNINVTQDKEKLRRKDITEICTVQR